MDNKFINIDDLVRQRLGGAAEPERPGAWMRMQELLEEEDRRKPVGIYWKRVISYCGVAMFLAAVSVGGYEISSAYRTHGGSTNQPAAYVAAGHSKTGNTATAANEITSTAKETVTNTIAGNAHNNSHAHGVVVHHEHNASGAAAIHSAGEQNSPAANAVNQQNKISASTGNAGIPAIAHEADKIGSPVAVNKITAAHTEVTEHIASAGTGVPKNNMKNAGDNQQNKVATSLESVQSSVNTVKAAGSVIKENSNNAGTVSGSNHSAASKETSVSGLHLAASTGVNINRAKNTPAAPGAQHTNVTVAKNMGHNTAVVKPVNTNKVKPAFADTKIAANKPAPVTHTPMPPAKPIEGKQVIERIVMHQTVLASGAGKTETRLDTISIDKINVAIRQAKEQAEQEAREKAAAATAAAESENNAVTHKGGVPTATSSSTGTGSKNKTAAAPSTPTKGNVLSAAKSTPASGNNTSAVSKTGVTTNTVSAEPGAAVTENEALASAPAPAPIVPNATAPAADATPATTPATDAKTNIKKKHGLNMAESLSNMFNEVKYKLGGVQFAPGITAGINGTFFGPNSFKGFQFGLTGAFEMSDEWSLFTELKYFHRMNNNYALYDNNIVYNPSTTGTGYERDSVQSAYSFSTLHSFELPVSIRYTAGRFSFFGGANFLYTLRVDPGQNTTTTTTANVATPGAVTNPTVSGNDFNSRFGVGYLCGFSYRVTPNLSFDFRNVQTVWDNAHTSGAKEVSGQLYKSPSLQLSIFYRLGKGNSENNKD